MASEPFLDLATIDLTAVAVAPEEVGRMNPQCGDMRQLDRVILFDLERGISVGVKRVRHDEFWVPLHIPGRPLMPGVLMIEAAAQLSSIHYRKLTGEEQFLGFIRVDETVFRGQVVPGDDLYLLSKQLKVARRRFESACQGIVNGRLVIETRVTGMVI